MTPSDVTKMCYDRCAILFFVGVPRVWVSLDSPLVGVWVRASLSSAHAWMQVVSITQAPRKKE